MRITIACLSAVVLSVFLSVTDVSAENKSWIDKMLQKLRGPATTRTPREGPGRNTNAPTQVEYLTESQRDQWNSWLRTMVDNHARQRFGVAGFIAAKVPKTHTGDTIEVEYGDYRLASFGTCP